MPACLDVDEWTLTGREGRTYLRDFLDFSPNREMPRYTALGHGDDYLESGDDLQELLGAVRPLARGEDVVVWKDDGTLAAVVIAGKALTFEEGNGRTDRIKKRLAVLRGKCPPAKLANLQHGGPIPRKHPAM
jgi:hypothetical protein